MTLPVRFRLFSTFLVAIILVAACVDVAPAVTPSPTASPAASPTRQPSPSPTTTLAPPTQSAAPSATPNTSGSPGPTDSATPGPTVDPALAAPIDAVIAQVPHIRDLEPTADVPYEFITRDKFRDDLMALNDENVPPEVRAAEERFLKRLGLLPPDADMEALILELYGASVAAFYRPDNGRFYIIERDQPFGPSDKIVVSHEYTHALQDQHFDLEERQISDPFEGDAALGQLAVIEGDASLTSQLWATDNLTPDEMFELLMESLGELDQPTLAGMPLVLRRQLEFPYVEGLLFVTSLHDQEGYDGVDAALQAPPASTEQILHPEKYFGGEAPVDVEVADLLGQLDDGWISVYEQTMGELGIQILAVGGEEPDFNIPGLPVDWPHSEVAAGWAGDRLSMYEGPEGAWLIDWLTTWDTQADAGEFEARIAELEGSFAGPARVDTTQQGVRVRVASSEQLLFDCCR